MMIGPSDHAVCADAPMPNAIRSSVPSRGLGKSTVDPDSFGATADVA
jgi:hypothetical protein